MALMQTFGGFVTLVLVITGVAGTIYKLISPGGWIAHAWGQSMSAGTAVLGSLAFVLLLAWFSRAYASPREHNRRAGLFVYMFAAAGFLYIARYWMHGAL